MQQCLKLITGHHKGQHKGSRIIFGLQSDPLKINLVFSLLRLNRRTSWYSSSPPFPSVLSADYAAACRLANSWSWVSPAVGASAVSHANLSATVMLLLLEFGRRRVAAFICRLILITDRVEEILRPLTIEIDELELASQSSLA